MNTEQALQIVQYIIVGLSVLIAVIQFVYNKKNGSKSKFLANFLSLLDEVSSSIEFAEQMTKMNKDEKKSFAERLITMFCENKGFKITSEQLNLAVERVIKTTKKVNVDGKYVIEENKDGFGGNVEVVNGRMEENQAIANHD